MAENPSTAAEANHGQYERIEPFKRSLKEPITLPVLREQIQRILKKQGVSVAEDDGLKLFASCVEPLLTSWRKRDSHSEKYLRSSADFLNFVLLFSKIVIFYFLLRLMESNIFNFKSFRMAVPHIFDSDLTYGTKYRDSLLFALTLYDVNTGKNRLRELYAAVPGVRKSLLGVSAKQFGEKFHHLQKRIARHSSRGSLESIGTDKDEDSDEPRISTGGIANTHFQQRVINVSNAPPVSLKREKSGDWEIKQGSGGLVSCVDPVMTKDHENIWLANLGMNLKEKKRLSFSSEESELSKLAPSTNTLGLPLIKQAIADVFFHVLADDDQPEKESNADQKKARSDYNVYYGGISNGLLWPALHNLPEYIVPDYDTPKVFHETILVILKSGLVFLCAMVFFALIQLKYLCGNLDFADFTRPLVFLCEGELPDFIWIHDYHLMLTGMVGFFLHIPFQPSDDFFTKYGTCGLAVLRGLLRFTKLVQLQTHRDRSRYIELVQQHLRNATVYHDQHLDIFTVTHEGWTCSLGVFPVSIKNDDFLKFVHMPETLVRKDAIRKKILGENPPENARLFFSVERFDYTKGIKEKLLAYQRYFKKYPDRIGKDVLYQVAVTNRRSVDTYRFYQDECLEIAKKIASEFRDPTRPEWKPSSAGGISGGIHGDGYRSCHTKEGRYESEMLVCNPHAGLILSTGAGAEIQFSTSGLYKEDGEKNYHRISDLFDVESYADTFYAAATESVESREVHGKRLSDFILSNDIERWSTAFLDPSWTHLVIRQMKINTLDEFFSLMMRTRNVRLQIVNRVLKGIPIRGHFMISLRNAKESLTNSCEPDSNTLILRASHDSPDTARFDIKNELEEFEKVNFHI
uniref:T6PP_N domain-containing protein n=1 Tax=Angiostrongylus cantonensis TaxID=6313 RepID=A0A158PCD3_ANGCA